MSTKKQKPKSKPRRQPTSWAIIDGQPQQVVIPETRGRRRKGRARTGAMALQPTDEQLAAARARGWRFRYYWPGQGYCESPVMENRGPAPVGVFTRSVKVADAAMKTVPPTPAAPTPNNFSASSGNPLLLQQSHSGTPQPRVQLSQLSQGISAGKPQKGGVPIVLSSRSR